MNRRAILKLLGGSVAAPAVSVKAAAGALGLGSTLSSAGLSDTVGHEHGGVSYEEGWYGSPAQMFLESKDRAAYNVMRGGSYSHMKSWGHAFRVAAETQDVYQRSRIDREMGRNEKFREKVLRMTGLL